MAQDDRAAPTRQDASPTDVTAPERTGEALAASEERFRRVVEASPMGLLTYRLEPDDRLVFTGANPAADRILGVDCEQFVGLTIEEAFPPLAATEIPARYRAACRDGTPWTAEQVLYEDERIHGAYEVHAFQTAPGRMAAFFLDITERKQIENERRALEAGLRESEARYRLLTERQRDVVVSVAPDGTLLYCSPAIREFGGYDPDEELGENLAKYVHPDDLPAVLARLDELIRARRALAVEFRYLPKTGEPFPIEVSGIPVVEDGEVRSVQAILRDVRERKRAEVAQRERLDRIARQQDTLVAFAAEPAFARGDYGATADRVVEGAVHALASDWATVWMWDEDGASIRQIAFHGHVETAPVRAPAIDRRTALRLRTLFRTERATAITDPRLLARLVRAAGRATGEVAPGSLLVAPIRARGEVRGAVAAAMATEPRAWHPEETSFAVALGDHLAQALLIAERVRAEEEKERLREQLLQAQRLEAVGQLAGGVAHDFNNLLTGISGYADLVFDGLDPRDPLREDVEEIRAATSRAAWLTSQLLTFSRRQVVTPRVIRIDEEIERLRRMLGRLIGDDIHLTFTPGAGVWAVEADPGQIDQVLVNLATNARDAMPGGGTLAIETANVEFDAAHVPSQPGARAGAFVRVRVRDDGAGMDDETLRRIFDPFFSTKDVGEGTGLGLATVYGIVQQSGGFIEVRSRVGEGTTFDIHFPRSEAAPARAAARDESATPPPGEETILVVEDDPTIRRLVRRILTRRGYVVLEAQDGLEARRRMAEEGAEVDLLLSDVVMPKMDGRELLLALREERPDLRTLFMSGHAEDIVAHRAILDDRTGFVQKPFATRDLLRRVRDLLDR